MCLFLSLATDGFLTSLNLFNIGRQISLLGIMSIGMTFVLISGEVDLSVGSTYAFSGLSTGMLIVAGWALAPALCVGLARRRGDRPDQRPALDLWSAAVADRHARHAEHRARRGAHPDQRTAGDRQCSQRRRSRRCSDAFEFMGQGYLFGVVPMQLVFFAPSPPSPGWFCPTPISAFGFSRSAAAPRRRGCRASTSTR